MTDERLGYAVCGDGKIVKTTDGGNNWFVLLENDSVYCRSVEFVDTLTGYVGGFCRPSSTLAGNNVLRKTTDGGLTWTDLTPLIHQKAKRGICGLAIADKTTIYGCGNWYQDSGYIIKSTDAGSTWSFIDMRSYASSVIDMYFLNKDTGFAVGKGPRPQEAPIILYTTDGGASWDYKFYSTIPHGYCWKIQRLDNKTFFGSIEDMGNVPAKIVKSVDGGMTWTMLQVSAVPYYLEGVGFIDEKKGWAGGDQSYSYETENGGVSWKKLAVCPYMNRVFRVNDTLVFATGDKIWKFSDTLKIPPVPVQPQPEYLSMKCQPNPADNYVTIDIKLSVSTHVLLTVFDVTGKRLKTLDNSERPKGDLKYDLSTDYLPVGNYFIMLKTHEDKKVCKILVRH